jgi:hypothetical protein
MDMAPSESLPDLLGWYHLDRHKFQEPKSKKSGVRIPSQLIYLILCSFWISEPSGTAALTEINLKTMAGVSLFAL